MPKLRGRNTSRSVFQADTVENTRRFEDPQRDRLRIISECLRELRGIELIYAIRLPDGIIKIGHTYDINARRRHFNTEHAALLSVQPAKREDETALHKRLNASVARGREYYHPTAEVLAYVNGVRATMGIGPID